MNFPELTTKFTATFKEVYAAPDGTYERGYNDGHAQGYDDGYTIGEAEGYKDGTTDGYNSGYGEGYTTGEAEGYENGKQAEYDAFWDAFQNYGKRTAYYSVFSGSGWTDNNFKPKYDIKMTYSARQAFLYNGVSDLAKCLEDSGVTMDISQATDTTQIFYGAQCKRLPVIDFSNSGTSGNGFYDCKKLETIDMFIPSKKASATYGGEFTNCSKLKNIKFGGDLLNTMSFAYSAELSGDSIKSIVNHLSDTATGKTLTLSQTAVSNAIFGDNTTAAVSGAMSNFIPTITVPVADGERVKVTLETDEGHYIGTDYFWGELKPDDWYIGICSGGEPCEREFILSQENYTAFGGTGYVYVWFATGGAANFNYTVRAVRIDENGNEIDGINLYNLPDGTYTEYNGTTYTLTKESWESLAASKPNWTITLS